MNFRHEVVNVNLKHKPDWFMQRHPFGLVPILERNEVVIGESAVCNDYLDRVYPQQPLYPTDAVQAARHKMLMSMFEKVHKHASRLNNIRPVLISSTFCVKVAGRFGAIKSRDQDAKVKALRKFTEELTVFEEFLTDTFFGGFTSDFCLGY